MDSFLIFRCCNRHTHFFCQFNALHTGNSFLCHNWRGMLLLRCLLIVQGDRAQQLVYTESRRSLATVRDGLFGKMPRPVAATMQGRGRDVRRPRQQACGHGFRRTVPTRNQPLP